MVPKAEPLVGGEEKRERGRPNFSRLEKEASGLCCAQVPRSLCPSALFTRAGTAVLAWRGSLPSSPYPHLVALEGILTQASA